MLRKLLASSILFIVGCTSEHMDDAEYEKQLRLQCPCVMFSDEQRAIFEKLKTLDYFVVVPASGLNTQDSIRLDKATVYGIRASDSCFINKNILGAADDDENRFRRFNAAMHTDHKILWSLRGGYGSYRLISFLKKLPKPKHKKIFVGFSDTTAMSLFISQNWKNWETIHAPVFIHLVNKEFHKENFDLLMQILHGTIKTYSIRNIKPLNSVAVKSKKVSGRVTGGNLTLLETSLATIWEVDTKNKIIFIEDTGESASRIYRSLQHLKQAGKFKHAKAVIFGTFAANWHMGIHTHLKQFASELSVPVFVTDQFGHGKFNMPIVYNAKSTIYQGIWTISLPHNWNKQW